MAFVVDTVGEITFPDGTTGKGVVLAVPLDATEDEALAAVREAAKMWSDRVPLIAAGAARHRAREMNADLPADQREVMQLKGMI